MIEINLEAFYEGTAKISQIGGYCQAAVEKAGDGNEIVLTGKAPVWMYLTVAHALHGKARKLVYRSPNTGDVLIFDHDPF